MTQQIIYQREDGSFVIAKNGYPYHIPNEGEYQALWIEISAGISSGELTVIPEPHMEEPEADPEAERLARIEAVKLKLIDLDLASIRPLREINNGTDTQEDHDRLAAINEHVVILRKELRNLTMAANT